MTTRPVAVMTLTTLAAACTGTEPGAPAGDLLILHSLGIRIVENPGRAPDSTSWWIVEEPLLTIDDDESKGDRYVFGEIVGAARLSNGRIVVIRKRRTAPVIPRRWSDSIWRPFLESSSAIEALRWLAQVEPPPVPEHARAIDRMLLDGDGALWAQEDPPGHPEPAQWFVFDSVGVLRHSIRIDLAVTQIGSDRVGVGEEDALGLQTVSVYRLMKR